MKMSGPNEFKTPNTYPMIHTPAIPRAVTDTEYRAILLDMLGVTTETELAHSYTIEQLEEDIVGNGMHLPIVKREGRHYCDFCNKEAHHCYREGQGTGHSEHVCACEDHKEDEPNLGPLAP